eukprot:m.125775 g.125775  ORF g.125775 m.125775 type:complete len:575 (+) comp19797_c0_seq1:55-1779(+)
MAKKTKKSNAGTYALWGSLGSLVLGILVLFLLPDTRMVPEPLSAMAMPSEKKYQQVLKDEKIREALLDKKLTPEEAEERLEGYRKNEFNQFLSDRLSLTRRAYDTRDPSCLQERYLPISVLPTASVIIIFHNEARSTLLRTVMNVLDRSPAPLIKEVLLIDDGSTLEHLGQELENEVATIPKVRLLRMPERAGLIRAKLYGADHVTGDVMVFLDSHCECIDGWLEPLLDRIKRNRKTIAMPIIDAIDQHTMELRTARVQRGVFTWTQMFYWVDLNLRQSKVRQNAAEPVVSPAMAGGIFAMDRKYFFEIGSYDEGLDTWGGENIEMSLRTWMCGGRLEILPCSRVGHIFRDKTPYKFKHKDPAETIGHNLNRVAEVWMDDYKEIYYNRSENGKYPFGDVSARIKLREDLKCKDFQWYLDNIFPELFVPRPENYHVSGKLKHAAMNVCLNPYVHDVPGVDSDVFFEDCSMSNFHWLWYVTKLPVNGHVRNEHDKGSYCLRPDRVRDGANIMVVKCLEKEGDLISWRYNAENKQLSLENSRLCLSVENTTLDNEAVTRPVLRKCDSADEQQHVDFE